MSLRRIMLSAVGILCSCITVRAAPVTFADFGSFERAVGAGLQVIDFDTLPDGTPSVDNTPIAPEFNYADLGVTFSSPFPDLFIAGNSAVGFALASQNPDTGARNWITGHFVPRAFAVGIVFPGFTTLSVFDESTDPIVRLTGGGTGFGHFLGIVSDVPILWMTQDRGSSGETMESFLFTPVPEPGTLLLLASGSVIVLRRRLFVRYGNA